MFSDPAAIREIFTGEEDALRAGEATVVLQPILGPNSLLLIDGERHLRERRMMMPPFHGDRMRAYGETMRDVTEGRGRYVAGRPAVPAPRAHPGRHPRRDRPEPDRFRAERFLGTRPSPYEFFPFRGGSRRCPGMAFALYEMKVVLATLLARADFALAPGSAIRVVRRNITWAPSEGMPVVLTRRGA